MIANDTFEMSKIKKDKSGLPFDIWVDSVGKDRNIGYNSQCIFIIKDNKEIGISFYGEPKIESGAENLKSFGEIDVNIIKDYIKTHKALFFAHWNQDIDDCEISIAMILIKKNPKLIDDKAIEQAKNFV